MRRLRRAIARAIYLATSFCPRCGGRGTYGAFSIKPCKVCQ